METETTNEVNLNPDTPEHPVTHLETQRKTAVTPLDMNRFQSKAFRMVMYLLSFLLYSFFIICLFTSVPEMIQRFTDFSEKS